MIFKSMQKRDLRYKIHLSSWRGVWLIESLSKWLKNSRGQHLVSILEMCLSYIGVRLEEVDLIFQIRYLDPPVLDQVFVWTCGYWFTEGHERDNNSLKWLLVYYRLWVKSMRLLWKRNPWACFRRCCCLDLTTDINLWMSILKLFKWTLRR